MRLKKSKHILRFEGKELHRVYDDYATLKLDTHVVCLTTEKFNEI